MQKQTGLVVATPSRRFGHFTRTGHQFWLRFLGVFNKQSASAAKHCAVSISGAATLMEPARRVALLAATVGIRN
jgi:hypothetical protein